MLHQRGVIFGPIRRDSARDHTEQVARGSTQGALAHRTERASGIVSLGALRAFCRSPLVLTTNDRAVVSGRNTFGRSVSIIEQSP